MMVVRSFRPLAVSLLACLWLGQSALHSAERRPSGRDIFRKQCAECHGRNGQGVKGKYDSPLQGDWSLARLTRVIDRTMPEDAPEKCVGENAGAVARYVYDAFYSREARLRNNPPRVELVRLTNRQYLNTVADLLKQFTGKDSALSEERGLRAVSYDSKHFRQDKKIEERVDRQVNLDFGQSGLLPEHTGTNEFSIQWRGSVIADETGDHQFVVKTPNGVRLWINDDATAVIDAGVASGDIDEHKTTVRLIGGRAYLLRLDWFKAAKDPSASIALLWKPPHGGEQLIPARNLSPVRVTETFVATTPFPADDSSVGYERGVAVSKAWDEAATHAAIEVANHVVKHLDRLSKSQPKDADRAAKVEAFCNEFVASAFRRPLTPEQERLFVSAHFKDANLDDAVKRVVLLALKSPRFLYLGLENQKADDFAVAARLSFALWDSLPDRELRDAAAQGRLRTREQLDQQARRMLADPRARAKTQQFLHQWLQMNHVEDFAKDTDLFPGFTPEIVADLRASLDIFLEDVIWKGSADYRELLRADYLHVNDRLAAFYGVNTNVAGEFVKVTIASGQRSGVVTHPYLLSAFSYRKFTSPIHRGVFLTRNIVGRALKPPPVAVEFNETAFAPNLTMREKVAELTSPKACQSCHSVINPLGFSLEHFDAVGRFRTSENDRLIDAASDYVTDDGQTVRFAGARDVAEFAINSEQALDGFIEQLFHHLVKQPMLAYGADVTDRLRQSFVASEFNVRTLLTDIAAVAALHGVEKPVQATKKLNRR